MTPPAVKSFWKKYIRRRFIEEIRYVITYSYTHNWWCSLACVSSHRCLGNVQTSPPILVVTQLENICKGVIGSKSTCVLTLDTFLSKNHYKPNFKYCLIIHVMYNMHYLYNELIIIRCVWRHTILIFHNKFPLYIVCDECTLDMLKRVHSLLTKTAYLWQTMLYSHGLWLWNRLWLEWCSNYL